MPRETGSVFRGTVIGRFAEAGPAHRGIVAVVSTAPSAAVQAFRIAGIGTALDSTLAAGTAVGGVVECGGGASVDICVSNAALFAWPRSPAQDVMLAVDRQVASHAGLFDPAATPITVTQLPALTGDGVADGVGLDGVVGTRSLVVYPQCSSRELERCRPAPGTGGGS